MDNILKIGVIVDIQEKSQDGVVFDMIDLNKEKHTIKLNEYQNIMVGDSIAIDSSDNIKQLIIPSEKENIKMNFCQALGMESNKAEKIYKSICEKINSTKPEDVEKYLSETAYNYYLIDRVTIKIESLSGKSIGVLLKWWIENRDYRRLYFLGMNKKEIKSCDMAPMKIYEKLQKNPYAVSSINMKKAARMCEIMNINPTKEHIYMGEVLRSLKQVEIEKKWISFPCDKFNEDVRKEMFEEENLLDKYFSMFNEYDIIYYNNAFQLRHNYDDEKLVVSFLDKLIKKNLKDYKNYEVGKKVKIETLTEEQNKAINAMLYFSICFITGPAGTGKTTLLKEAMKIFDKRGDEIIMCSFTGKAVSRIQQVIGQKGCFTIDRLITAAREGYFFDYLIVDECSMVTINLFARLVKAFKHNFKVIFIGDNNQLPPVSAGWLSNELIKSQRIPVFKLTKNFRAETESLVTQANELINHKGIYEFRKDEIFHLIRLSEKVNGADCIEAILTNLKEAEIDKEEITIITPSNKNRNMPIRLFKKIFLKNNTSEIDVGDRVMQVENNYYFGVMNGEEGTVIRIEDDIYYVKIGKDIFEYHNNVSKKTYEGKVLKLSEIEISFCKTIHKTQGDEYNYVIVYIPKDCSFINKNYLYTALTRAKKELWMVYDKETVDMATQTKCAKTYENTGIDLLKLKTEDENILDKLIY